MSIWMIPLALFFCAFDLLPLPLLFVGVLLELCVSNGIAITSRLQYARYALRPRAAAAME